MYTKEGQLLNTASAVQQLIAVVKRYTSGVLATYLLGQSHTKVDRILVVDRLPTNVRFALVCPSCSSEEAYTTGLLECIHLKGIIILSCGKTLVHIAGRKLDLRPRIKLKGACILHVLNERDGRIAEALDVLVRGDSIPAGKRLTLRIRVDVGH